MTFPILEKYEYFIAIFILNRKQKSS